MTVSEKTRVVLEDLKTRVSRRRLRNWRRMVEGYAEYGMISRKPVRCLKCGRVVDMVCEECLKGGYLLNKPHREALIICGRPAERVR